jgi:hypothetical protein
MEFEQSGPLRTLPGETFGDESTLKTDKAINFFPIDRFIQHLQVPCTCVPYLMGVHVQAQFLGPDKATCYGVPSLHRLRLARNLLQDVW